MVNGVNGHNLLTAVDSIAEEDEEGGDIDGDDAVTAALAKERTLSTNSNRSVPGLVKIRYKRLLLKGASRVFSPGLFFGQFYGGQLRLVASEALSFFQNP